MEESRTDTIVIGAGVNGLVGACALARRGQGVVVLERGLAAGGLAREVEFHPGFRTAGLLHDGHGIGGEIVKALNLVDHGLGVRANPPPVFIPEIDGPGLLLHRDPTQARDELNKRNDHDAKAYAEFRAFLARITPILRGVLTDIPPNIKPANLAEILPLAWKALSARRLGAKTISELLRLPPMCLADYLNEWFHDEKLKCLLAADALRGASAGPWSPGTCALLLRNEALYEASTTNLVDALLSAAQKLGVEIRTNSQVAKINTDGKGATGVTLSDGTVINAKRILATCDPKQTFMQLLSSQALTTDVDREARAIRSAGVVSQVALAMKGRLEFACRPELVIERAVVADSIDGIEQSFDASKYNRFPAAPLLNVSVPTLAQPNLAPEGHSVVTILAQCTPYDLAGGWSESAKSDVYETVIQRLAAFAPGIESRIVGHQILTPVDIESRFGMTGGHLFHVEHALDQLILRPIPQAVRYATPIQNLYLGGAGSHPGGGSHGWCGWLAAKRMLRDLG